MNEIRAVGRLIGPQGEGTVIFPNKFQQDNFLPAEKEAQFPGPKTPFQFRPKDPGTETVVAICNATGKADGIKHHFKKRGFTELGKGRSKGKKENVPGVVQGAPASDILSRTAIKLVVK